MSHVELTTCCSVVKLPEFDDVNCHTAFPESIHLVRAAPQHVVGASQVAHLQIIAESSPWPCILDSGIRLSEKA